MLKIADPLAYQHAYLSSELGEIFNKAPPFSIDEVDEDTISNVTAISCLGTTEDVSVVNRKPIEDNECPICYTDFEPEKEAIVYCKAICGTNIHNDCLNSWLKAQQQAYGKSTCPYCRHDWVRS